MAHLSAISLPACFCFVCCVLSVTHPCTCTCTRIPALLPLCLRSSGWKTQIGDRAFPVCGGLEEGLGSESWLSSQEVLFLTALHKHWKRDPKKMSPTHYFHCKQADIHILYCSLSSFLSYVSSLSLAEVYKFSQRRMK